MVAIQNTQPVYTPSIGLPPTTTTTTSPVGTTTYSPNDTFNNNSGASSSSTAFDPNKKAGFAQKFMNSVGNAFGKVADWVGLGTISHFAKDNFKALDSDKSNNLNATEFSAVSQMIGQSFQQTDANADQQISFGEFKKIVGSLVDAEMSRLDTNTDGFLNMNETIAGGYKDCDFNNHDSNKDGLLSRNEFAGLLNDVRIKNH